MSHTAISCVIPVRYSIYACTKINALRTSCIVERILYYVVPIIYHSVGVNAGEIYESYVTLRPPTSVLPLGLNCYNSQLHRFFLRIWHSIGLVGRGRC